MALVTMKEMLKDARENKYAVGMFDVHNMEMVRAVVEAAEQEQAPVIMALAEGHVHSKNDIEEISNIMVYAAKKTKQPVAVHYDHGMHMEYIVQVLKCGFSSVMYDGSLLPFEENVRNTKEVVRLANLFDASVEAEIGHVGQGEDGVEDGSEMEYTKPEDAKRFVEETNVDALAVAIGTIHGVYRERPTLDLERLHVIYRTVDVPLVLHGGSGLSDKEFRDCIDNGISKVNIYTEIVQTAMKEIHADITNKRQSTYPQLMRQSVDAMRENITAHIRLFGSSHKA